MSLTASAVLPIVLVLASALFHAIGNAFFKASADKSVTRTATLILLGLIAVPIAASVPLPTETTWRWLAGAVVVCAVYQWMMIATFSSGDMSVVYPFVRGLAPPVVALGSSWVLGDILSTQQLVGIVFICISLMAIAAEPLFARNRIPRHSASLIGAAVVGGVCAGIYTLLDAGGVRSTENAWTYISWFFILLSTPLAGFLLVTKGPVTVFKAAKADLKVIAGSVAFVGLSYSLMLLALQAGSAGAISALRETSVVFASLIGVFIFREGFGLWRIIAACGVTIGAIIVAGFSIAGA